MRSNDRSLRKSLDLYFHVSERSSTFRTEVAAGVSTFLSLSYIFVIHPFILARIGLEEHTTLVLTVVVSTAATLACGLWVRLPFVFAPGLEMSLYIALVVVPLLKLTTEEAFSLVIVSGALLCCLGNRHVRHYVIDSVPHHFATAVAVTMAAFLLAIALSFIGVVDYQTGHWTIAGLTNAGWAATGCVVIILCELVGFRPSVLVGIMVVAVLAHSRGALANSHATSFIPDLSVVLSNASVRAPFSTIHLSLQAAQALFILFVLSSYGSLSKLIKLSKGTTIVHRGDIPGVNRMFVLDGLAAIASGTTGNSNVTTFVESGVGISVGGRTGLTSVTTGILMVCALGLLPFIDLVSTAAIVGALVYVGVQFVPDNDALMDMWIGEKITVLIMVLMVLKFLAIGIAFDFGLFAFCLMSWIKPFLASPHLPGANSSNI